MQINTGIRSILLSPLAYSGFQYLMGARSGWQKLVKHYIKANPGEKILDLGCGPADILNYLTDVDYWGFDTSAEYIQTATNKFGKRGHFKCKIFELSDLNSLPEFDVVLMSGFLHHVDDDMATEQVMLAASALKSGGRLVTVDPCFVPNQNPIARFLITHDRGQNVRNEIGYRSLVQGVYEQLDINIVNKTWPPYTHCYMVCTRK